MFSSLPHFAPPDDFIFKLKIIVFDSRYATVFINESSEKFYQTNLIEQSGERKKEARNMDQVYYH